MTTMLIEQIKQQSELIKQGYSPSIDLHNRSVLELLDAIDELLEELGPLAFETHVVERKQGGGTPIEYAILNVLDNGQREAA